MLQTVNLQMTGHRFGAYYSGSSFLQYLQEWVWPSPLPLPIFAFNGCTPNLSQKFIIVYAFLLGRAIIVSFRLCILSLPVAGPILPPSYCTPSHAILYIGRLQLTALHPNIVDENSIISVSDGSYVEVSCSGSEALTWEVSSGRAITGNNSSSNVFQAQDQINNIQRLVIQNFSSADAALYTCTTDVVNGTHVSESAYISSCECSQ